MTRYLGWAVWFIVICACGRQAEQRTVDLTVPVTVEAVKLGTMESLVEATGSLLPIREVELTTEIEGRFRWVPADGAARRVQGEEVGEGDIIARIDNQEHVVNARLQVRTLARELARKALDEQETLFKRGLTTENDVEDARREKAETQSSYEDALIRIAKTEVRSPVAGFLTALTDATEGTLLPNRTAVATVIDYRKVIIDLKIPNTYIAVVELDQPIHVENYAFPNMFFDGKITAVDPALDPSTRAFRVMATVENPELMLRPGMFVRAEIVTESREDVVRIPRQYVLTRRNQKVVFVEEGGRAQMVEVEEGLEDRTHVEIVSGLEPGDRLVTSNYETLRDRTRVRVTGSGEQ